MAHIQPYRVLPLAVGLIVLALSGCADLFAPKRLAARFDRAGYAILEGQTLDLRPHIAEGAPTVKWRARDAGIATVDSEGIVSGHSFGVATFEVTSSGWAPSTVRVWVARRTVSFDEDTDGCPTPAETVFVAAAFPVRDISRDTTTTMCTQRIQETVSMRLTQALMYRALVATAGLDPAELQLNTQPWSFSRQPSLFEWIAFDSGVRGWRIAPLPAPLLGRCCDAQRAMTLDLPNTGAQPQFLVSVIAHEARHFVVGPHRCPRVVGSVLQEDDIAIAELGAYAIQLFVLEALARSGATSPGEKQFLENQAAVVRTTRFCIT